MNPQADTVVTTYLEIRSPAQLQSKCASCGFDVREQTERDWRFNRDLYFKVGEQWRWIDKRLWTGAQWRDYANDPNLRTFAASCENKLAGYYELRRGEEADVEIAYFGLLPHFFGRGLGSALLTSAIENAWAWEPLPSRVWVHTCNHDHPYALANYQARGFKIYKLEREARSS